MCFIYKIETFIVSKHKNRDFAKSFTQPILHAANPSRHFLGWATAAAAATATATAAATAEEFPGRLQPQSHHAQG